jgi:hypothetical protein
LILLGAIRAIGLVAQQGSSGGGVAEGGYYTYRSSDPARPFVLRRDFLSCEKTIH